MTPPGRTWCVILAAGEGHRMRFVSCDASGNRVPKQYWHFDGRRSLLQAARERARRLASPGCVVQIVAEGHRVWWEPELRDADPRNVIVQPANKGTAAGVLLPLLHIARRDPQARVVLLPSDHGIGDESALEQSLRLALDEVERRPDEAVLLGVDPDEPDTEYGYILAESAHTAYSRPVLDFVEKPDADTARELLERNALWNTFIMSATLATWLDLYESSDLDLVNALTRAFNEGSDPAPLRALYADMPVRDFSHDILWKSVGRLRVLRAAPCDWLDVGTPLRYARWLDRAAGVDAAPRVLSA